EAVALAEEIVRRLGRTADSGKLGQPVGLDIELEAGVDDGGRNRIVAAAGAERRDRALVVAVGEAERIGGQARMAQLGLGDIGHSAASLAFIRTRSSMAAVMKRAVIGVPS